MHGCMGMDRCWSAWCSPQPNQQQFHIHTLTLSRPSPLKEQTTSRICTYTELMKKNGSYVVTSWSKVFLKGAKLKWSAGCFICCCISTAVVTVYPAGNDVADTSWSLDEQLPLPLSLLCCSCAAIVVAAMAAVAAVPRSEDQLHCLGCVW